MNKVYPKYKDAAYTSAANSSIMGTLKVALVDLADYTYSDSHEFFTSIAAAVVGTPQVIANKTFAAGLLDGDDSRIPTVAGDESEALVLFLETGTAGTSRLVAYLDSGVTGLPVSPNGGPIDIIWNALGIIQF